MPCSNAISILVLALAAAASAVGRAGQADEAPADQRRQVADLIVDLDSDDFSVRRRASQRLTHLADKPAWEAVVTAEARRVLLTASPSFEVRQQLQALGLDDVETTVEPPGEVAEDEIARLLHQFESDAFSDRLGALGRVQWLLRNPRMAGPIYLALKQRLSSEGLSVDARTWLDEATDKARAAWLMSDPADFALPAPRAAHVDAWLDVLADESLPGDQDAVRRAETEVENLLAQESTRSLAVEAIERRLADPALAPAAEPRLSRLLELTRPAMVAEYWEAREHLGCQHLLVDVPTLSPGAVRPSHFDRIDDRTAHCVTGSNLSEGDYPVGVAIPHPNRPGAAFHLVNLPTPRRRLAYEHYVKTPVAERRKALTKRTLARWKRQDRCLTEPELATLGTLDREEVSRFALHLIENQDDRHFEATDYQWSWRSSSHHGTLCGLLAQWGTIDSLEPLLEAIAADRVEAPTAERPYDLRWIAVLSIARRMPPAETARILGPLIARRDPLICDTPFSAELGATAAAVVMVQTGVEPAPFGLLPTHERVLDGMGLLGYRFQSPAARSKVLAWWKSRAVAR